MAGRNRLLKAKDAEKGYIQQQKKKLPTIVFWTETCHLNELMPLKTETSHLNELKRLWTETCHLNEQPFSASFAFSSRFLSP
jgi:hypothetical protein